MNTPARTSRLAVLALVLALLPFLACSLLVLAALALPDYFAPPPGHSSPLLGPSAWLIWIVGLSSLALFPAALLVGIIALVRISKRKPDLRGSAYAWAAIAITATIFLCWVTSNLLLVPLIAIP